MRASAVRARSEIAVHNHPRSWELRSRRELPNRPVGPPTPLRPMPSKKHRNIRRIAETPSSLVGDISRGRRRHLRFNDAAQVAGQFGCVVRFMHRQLGAALPVLSATTPNAPLREVHDALQLNVNGQRSGFISHGADLAPLPIPRRPPHAGRF
jgi:hypothetical protein